LKIIKKQRNGNTDFRDILCTGIIHRPEKTPTDLIVMAHKIPPAKANVTPNFSTDYYAGHNNTNNAGIK
jgi:hypothetical protein